MEPGSDWRVVDATADDAEPPSKSVPATTEDKLPRLLIAGIVAVMGAVCAIAIWATLPTGDVAVESSSGPFDGRVAFADAGLPRSSIVVTAAIVIDVEGAVASPGVHELPSDSRVGDAIAAAGGYALNADIGAAARQLNLAAKVTDGQQIRVPALGDAEVGTSAPAGAGASSEPATPGGLIDLNHASAEELDTLPGIGPVTAAKIIDARTQAPFATVDELQSRGVVGTSTFEKLRDLVTVTP